MTPYIGEIRMFAGNFAPAGWLHCDGTLLPISQYDALFQLLGTTYGGDGETTFALPNLQSRIPLHQSSRFPLGSAAGQEEVSLSVQQIPAHSHTVSAAAGTGTSSSAQGNVLASWASTPYLPHSGTPVALAPNSVDAAGGSQPHPNLPPYLAVNFIISLFGIFPPQS